MYSSLGGSFYSVVDRQPSDRFRGSMNQGDFFSQYSIVKIAQQFQDLKRRTRLVSSDQQLVNMSEHNKSRYVAILIATVTIAVVDISGYVFFRVSPYSINDVGLSLLGIFSGFVGLVAYERVRTGG